MRRIIIGVGIGVLVLGIIIVGYLLAQKPSSSDSDTVTTGVGSLPSPAKSGSAQGDLPTTASKQPESGLAGKAQRFGVVVSDPTLDFYVNPQNTVIFVQPDGRILSINRNVTSSISATQIPDLISASFSFDGKFLLTTFGDPNNPQSSVFEIDSRTWKPLSLEIKNPVWSPTDHRLAFFSSNNKGYVILATLDVDRIKASPKALSQLFVQNIVLDWPSKNTITLTERPSGLAGGMAWKYDLSAGALSILARPNPGLMIKWDASASSGIAFYAGSMGRGGSTNLISSDMRTSKTFELVTIPSKCVFSRTERSLSASSTPTSTRLATKPITENSVICGFIQNTQEFGRDIQPDSYLQSSFLSIDRLYRVNLGSGGLENIFPENTYPFDATDLKIISGKLFFINRYDNKLYALTIDQ